MGVAHAGGEVAAEEGLEVRGVGVAVPGDEADGERGAGEGGVAGALEGDEAVAAPAGGAAAGDGGGLDLGEHGEEGGLAELVLPDRGVAGEAGEERRRVDADRERRLAGEELVGVEHLLGGGREVAVEGVDGGPAALAGDGDDGGGAVSVGELEHAGEDRVGGDAGEAERLVAHRPEDVGGDRLEAAGAADPGEVGGLGVALDEEGARGLSVAAAVEWGLVLGEPKVHVLEAMRDLVADDHGEHAVADVSADQEGLLLGVVDAHDGLLEEVEEDGLGVGAGGEDAEAGLDPADQAEALGGALLIERGAGEVADLLAVEDADRDLAGDREGAGGGDLGHDAEGGGAGAGLAAFRRGRGGRRGGDGGGGDGGGLGDLGRARRGGAGAGGGEREEGGGEACAHGGRV